LTTLSDVIRLPSGEAAGVLAGVEAEFESVLEQAALTKRSVRQQSSA
jgi:hypothetical protein